MDTPTNAVGLGPNPGMFEATPRALSGSERLAKIPKPEQDRLNAGLQKAWEIDQPEHHAFAVDWQ